MPRLVLVSNMQLLLELLHLGHLLLLARRRLFLLLDCRRRRLRLGGRLVFLRAFDQPCNHISSAQDGSYAVPAGTPRCGFIRTTGFALGVLDGGRLADGDGRGDGRGGLLGVCGGRAGEGRDVLALAGAARGVVDLGEGVGEVLGAV